MSERSSTFVRCTHCGHGVFHSAKRCPHCNHRMRWNLKPLVGWAIAISIGLLVAIVVAEHTTIDDGRTTPPAAGNP